MKRFVLTCTLIVFYFCPVSAQETTDFQNRTILHAQKDMSKSWFLAGWAIGNGQYYGTSNINLFGGIGYRNNNWWLESMIQRQWSETGRKLLWDNRFQWQNNKESLYLEAAPFLDRKAFYNMAIFERRAWRRFNIGAETENVHKPGKDSLGAGPRISMPLGSVGKLKVGAAIAYQLRHNERNALRLYLVFNSRF